MTESAALPGPERVAERPSPALGITSLVLGILLVLGVLLWFAIGASLFVALVWVFPLVVLAATVIGAIHLVVAITATVLGILAIVRDRGRVTGIVGLVLTLLSTASAAFVAFFFVETMSVLGY